MISCPNKNDPQWTKMVEMLGEDKAYYYFNLHEGFMSESGMLELESSTIGVPKELEAEIPLEVWNSLTNEEQTKILNCL